MLKKLGNYKGLKSERPNAQITLEEANDAVKRYLNMNATQQEITGRNAQKNDIVEIDFTGYIDGEMFDGGSGTDYQLQLGSGTFIPGFEEQLEGTKKGDEVDVNVSFPEDYGSPHLAGKPALFKVKVKKINELIMPVLTEKARQEVMQNLAASKRAYVEEQYENLLMDEVIDDSEFDISEEHIDREADALVEEWKRVIQYNGVPVERYYSMTGKNDQIMKEELREQAILRIKSALILEEIAKLENITADDSDIESRITEMAGRYELPVETVKEKVVGEHMENLRKEIIRQKALQLLKA